MTSDELRKKINQEFNNIELSTEQFNELLTDFAKTYHTEQLILHGVSSSFSVDVFVEVLKKTLKGNKDVRVEFEKPEDNINYILDVCNAFKKELENYC